MQKRESAEFVDRWNVGCKKDSVIAFKVVCLFVLISFLEVINDLFGIGPRTESWRGSTFQKHEEKNQLGKNSENKIVKTGEQELYSQQTLSRALSELMPR